MTSFKLVAIVLAWSSVDIRAPTRIQERTGVRGANFARSGEEGALLFLFSETLRVQRALGEYKDPNIGVAVGGVRTTDQILGGRGKELAPEARTQLAFLLAGGPYFAGSGYCRKAEVLRLAPDKPPAKHREGVIWSYVDTRFPVPWNGPFSDTLPPCQAIVRVQRSGAEEFVACVPELWPKELSPSNGALVPRFVMLTGIQSPRWGKDRSFFLFETLPDNPFALRIGQPTGVVAMETLRPDSLVVLTSCGRCVRFNWIKDSWGKLYDLGVQGVLGLARSADGHTVYWESKDGLLMSGTSKDLTRIDERRSEGLALKGKTSIRVASDGERVWVVAAEELPKETRAVLVSHKHAPGQKWSPWEPLAALPPASSYVIEAHAETREQVSTLYVAITDRSAGKLGLYSIAAVAKESGSKAGQ